MPDSSPIPAASTLAGPFPASYPGFLRGLDLFDSVMVVAGAMIGSGIFIVSADMSRLVGSPGALLTAWAVTGVLTIAAALSYGELSSMIPAAGGMYVYLREAYSPLWGFLYGWTLFGVIQTGTIAAVAVAFARFSSVLWPTIREDHYLIPPIHFGVHYAISLSTAQLTGIAVIALLTWTNTQGLEYGKIVQNIFTVAKAGALGALILLGFTIGRNAHAIAQNFGHLWAARGFHPISGSLDCTTAWGLLVAICVAQSGSLFSADSWHDVTFAAEEVKNPERTLPRALALGVTAVIVLYFLANVAYLTTLPFPAIQRAPQDLVATAMLQAIFPGFGTLLMAIAIMVSSFGCINGLVLAGPRAYYAMAADGLFFKAAGRLNRHRVPGRSLVLQGCWAAFLVLPRTYNAATGQYGNLYSNLLDYVISAALIFYILTIAGVIRLRVKRPELRRPFRTPGYPVVPALYIAGAGVILAVLLVFRPATTWPGLLIVLAGLVVYLTLSRSKRRDAA
jgi:APA family basic amino acid/polyamine antiporter